MVVITYVLVHILTEHSHDLKSVALLQNRVDVPGSYTETRATLSGNGNQFLFVNIDEVADIKAEEDPEPTTSPLIKTEPAVSCLCVCVCIQCYSHCMSPVSPSVHIRYFDSVDSVFDTCFLKCITNAVLCSTLLIKYLFELQLA